MLVESEVRAPELEQMEGTMAMVETEVKEVEQEQTDATITMIKIILVLV